MEQTKTRTWAAGILSGAAIAFMLFDSVGKLFKPAVVVESTLELGYAEHHLAAIGIIGLISTLLYAFSRTAFLGAVLLTGYLGGAIATHVRLDSPLFTHTLFPAYVAVLVWGGLWLRKESVRRLFFS
jgi:hypothetical protein